MPQSNHDCLTITQINNLAKATLEEIQVWIKGEVSSCSPDKYFYIYFDLKDENSKIRCIFPSQKLKLFDFKFENGIVIKTFGKLSIFERDGQYQFKAEIIEKDGAGDLQAKIEEIKNRLQKEGLFDESRKRSLPAIPERIGVVTSKDSAAWKDFYKILNERYPNIEIILYDALVQGNKAAKDVIKGLNYINSLDNIDLIVITRGGGADEDLMAFNDEELAREIAKSKYPVVSAIGHEKDTSISDLVADKRASTPSNAAELISPDIEALFQELDTYISKMKKYTTHIFEVNNLNLESIVAKTAIYKPEKLIQIRYDILDNLAFRIISNKRVLDSYKLIIEELYKKVFLGMNLLVKHKNEKLDDILELFKLSKKDLIKNSQNLLDSFEIKIKLNDPLQILKKGYSINIDSEGKIVKSINQVKEKQIIETTLSDGSYKSSILSIKNNGKRTKF